MATPILSVLTLYVSLFCQVLRERRAATEQTDEKTAQKVKTVDKEDEISPFSKCSPVDLDKVCVRLHGEEDFFIHNLLLPFLLKLCRIKSHRE